MTAVKRAFRSPSKENDKRNTRRKEEKSYDCEAEEEEEKVNFIFTVNCSPFFLWVLLIHGSIYGRRGRNEDGSSGSLQLTKRM